MCKICPILAEITVQSLIVKVLCYDVAAAEPKQKFSREVHSLIVVLVKSTDTGCPWRSSQVKVELSGTHGVVKLSHISYHISNRIG